MQNDIFSNAEKIFLSIISGSLQVLVDVVYEGGHRWVKVIARNAQALHLTWAGKYDDDEGDDDNDSKNDRFTTN